jgi:hypothetical protein
MRPRLPVEAEPGGDAADGLVMADDGSRHAPAQPERNPRFHLRADACDFDAWYRAPAPSCGAICRRSRQRRTAAVA